MRLLCDIPCNNLGDSVITFASIMKFTHMLESHDVTVIIDIPVNEIMYNYSKLYQYYTSTYNFDKVTVNICKVDDIIDVEYDICICYECAMFAKFTTVCERIDFKSKQVLYIKSPRNKEDYYIDLHYLHEFKFPLICYFNELHKQILIDFFDIDPSSRYSTEIGFGYRPRQDPSNRKQNNFLFAIANNGSSPRFSNDHIIRFIEELNRNLQIKPRIVFPVYENKEDVEYIASRIDNDIELVEYTIDEMILYIIDNVSVVFSSSTGILHAAAFAGATTVELSPVKFHYHACEWLPPCYPRKHFIISQKMNVFSDYPTIDFELSAHNLCQWLIKRDYCVADDIISSYRLLYDTINELKHLTIDDTMKLINALDLRARCVDNTKY